MLFALAACDSAKKEEDADKIQPAICLESMDQSVSPKTDFYRYVNGGWMQNNPLKPEYGRYGTFDMLRDSALSITKRIITDMQNAHPEVGSDMYKAATLYKMVMDSVTLNKDGAKPVLPRLQEVDEITSKEALVDYLAMRGNRGSSMLFSSYVYSDDENSDMNILHLVQGGLIMGNRDFYLEKDKYENFRQAYIDYLTTVFSKVMPESSEHEALAKEVLKTETALAEIQYSKLQLRDSELNYNKKDRETFFKAFKFPWEKYFNARKGLDNFKEINVAQYGYFESFDKWFTETPLESIKQLLKAKILDGAASFLSDDFREASFEFHGRTIGGREQMMPRWKTAVNLVNGSFGHVVAKIYTKDYFPPEAKEKMITLIDNLKSSLSERINALEWMSSETKERAQAKLSTFKVKVGYPDKWDSYEKIDVDSSSLLAYLQNITEYEIADNVKDLGKPVDKEEWHMNPHEVNAYYLPTSNEICFPAGILQPPFFNLHADDPVNYGAIGVVIGHEMTHGFDDQGRNYDEHGNMLNWWQKEDESRFKEAASKLADQYDQLTVTDDMHADGKLTLGENIADQGGLLIAHMAMQKAIGEDAEKKIDGFTPDQRFFIAYARLWGQNIRKEEIIRLTKIDVHSLGEFRVNQALKNIPAFYKAFDIKDGDAMYLSPEERVLVW